ncbi:MAG: hypothetical protein ACE3JK_00020 [Sporolactobacillus sp.]
MYRQSFERILIDERLDSDSKLFALEGLLSELAKRFRIPPISNEIFEKQNHELMVPYDRVHQAFLQQSQLVNHN